MKVILAAFLKFPGLFLNLLFLGYFVFLEPGLLVRLLNVIDHDAKDPLLAALFLIAPFLELAGFYLVVPSLLNRLAQAPRQPSSLPVFIWMAHLVLNVVLLLNGFACIGFDTQNGPPVLGIVLVAAMIIKEIGYLLYWIDQADPHHLEVIARRRFSRRPQVTPAPQFLGWLLLAPFAALSFTGFWGLLIAQNPIHYSRPGDAAVELALAVFIFLLIFAGARSVYLIEEWAFLRGRGPVLAWGGTLLLNLLVALASLPRA